MKFARGNKFLQIIISLRSWNLKTKNHQLLQLSALKLNWTQKLYNMNPSMLDKKLMNLKN